MNTKFFLGHNSEKISEKIEIIISYNDSGSPYCEFMPAEDFSATESFPGYLTAEGGYPEMYPINDDFQD